jgi:hypothetical protein
MAPNDPRPRNQLPLRPLRMDGQRLGIIPWRPHALQAEQTPANLAAPQAIV